jgi:transcriptional regulator with XRE-family HTH domain
VRLICRLREHRGKRGLRETADLIGMHAGQLSQIELGRMVPRDDQIALMEPVYGVPFEEWYSPLTIRVLAEDAADG